MLYDMRARFCVYWLAKLRSARILRPSVRRNEDKAMHLSIGFVENIKDGRCSVNMYYFGFSIRGHLSLFALG